MYISTARFIPECCTSAFYGFESNNQYVLPTAILLLTTACGVDLVYWILWLSLGKLVLVGHSKSISNATDANFLFALTLHIQVTLSLGIRNVDILQHLLFLLLVVVVEPVHIRSSQLNFPSS